jgi:hypothetical protein
MLAAFLIAAFSLDYRLVERCDPNRHEHIVREDTMYVANSWFIGVTRQLTSSLDGGAISASYLVSTIVLSSQFLGCKLIGPDILNPWGGACCFHNTPLQYSRCGVSQC